MRNPLELFKKKPDRIQVEEVSHELASGFSNTELKDGAWAKAIHLADMVKRTIESAKAKGPSGQINTAPILVKSAPPEEVLPNYVKAWEIEDQQLFGKFPRLAFVQLGKHNVLCSVFPVTMGQIASSSKETGLAKNPRNSTSKTQHGLIITPSAITQQWLEDLYLHPYAENQASIETTIRFLSVLASFSQPNVVEQYMLSCQPDLKNQVVRANTKFAHQDGIWSIISATSQDQSGSGVTANALVSLLSATDGKTPLQRVSIANIAHAHNLDNIRASRVSRAQLSTGIIGGLKADSFLYSPGVNPAVCQTFFPNFKILRNDTHVRPLMRMEGRRNIGSVFLPVQEDEFESIGIILRSLGIQVSLDEKQIQQTFDVVSNQQDSDEPLFSVVKQILN